MVVRSWSWWLQVPGYLRNLAQMFVGGGHNQYVTGLDFFVFGWVLFNHHKTLADFTKLSAFKLGVWLCRCIAAVMLSRYQMQYMHEYYLQIKVAFVISYAVMMWTSCMLFIGLFKKIANKPNAFTQKLADSSYGLYLVHLPLVVWLQVAVAELTMPLIFKLFIIFTSTVAISLLLIESIKFLKIYLWIILKVN